MAATLGIEAEALSNNPVEEKGYTSAHKIPPVIKNLFQDLANIRMTLLTESPQMLPLVAPSLIEAEVHIRQIWQSQY